MSVMKPSSMAVIHVNLAIYGYSVAWWWRPMMLLHAVYAILLFPFRMKADLLWVPGWALIQDGSEHRCEEKQDG